MLYPKNTGKSLDMELFEKPTCEYRGTPFWSWNCKLEKDVLLKQIEYLKEMGFGGFHIHSRTGMASEYLGTEFMEMVRACTDKARKEQMLSWLYDEDRWPSGGAGGIVTKDPKYRERMVIFTPNEMEGCVPAETAASTGEPCLLACYDIVLNENGELASYKRTSPDKKAAGDRWYAYLKTSSPSSWYNDQTYLDTLSNEAVDRFIEVTYEAYKKTVGDSFGDVVPAIFTDEPNFSHKSNLDFAQDKKEVSLPWTCDFAETYKAAMGIDILDFMPELIWELPNGGVSPARYHYHDHVAERFAAAFADRCGKWCEENGIMLTGHLLSETTLGSQTNSVGDAMRSYRSFQLPGIDMLFDYTEFTTAKQAQSACHQYGRDGVMSELYGVTNWDFDFRGHKFQGDWQAALGVTVRVPHLSWVSMAGEAKRDYPASISYQSPWFREYPYVEDHFARLNTVLTRGKPVVKVGVIHPVESYWLWNGPNENTGAARKRLENSFTNITEWLLRGQIDFDYICESILPDLCPAAKNPLKVGEMEYDTIIVPACDTLRSTTAKRLADFARAGGRLIFAGECPKYVDAVPSDEIKSLYLSSKTVPFERDAILSALACDRLIDIRNAKGNATDNLIYALREDGDCRWLFIARADKVIHADTIKTQKIRLKIKGELHPSRYDTISGEVFEIDYAIENGWTVIETVLNSHDSLLLRLGESAQGRKADTTPKAIVSRDFKHKVSYTRSEPNVLLLDMAEYAFDGGELNAEEELLRIDNEFRKLLGYPLRMAKSAQPWTRGAEKFEHRLALKFTFSSEVKIEKPLLAVEDAERLTIRFNGAEVLPNITGHYVDLAIKTVELPPIKEGTNVLELEIPFGETANVEYCYILGDFNVRVEGCTKTVTAASSEIGFGSIAHQGMPFYGGNVVYKMDFELDSAQGIIVRANNYRGALIGASLDGKPIGVIAYSPYELIVENVKAGGHTLELTLYGNRYNTFGQLHNANTELYWFGPNSWRGEGASWAYEYKLKDTGIMASPVIELF